MGAEALAQRGEGEAGEEVFRFQTLVALMLSSQTKDGVVADCMRRMQVMDSPADCVISTDCSELL